MLKLSNSRVVLLILCILFLSACIKNNSDVTQKKVNSLKDTVAFEPNVKEEEHDVLKAAPESKFGFNVETYTATELGVACYESDTTKIQSLINSGFSIEECLTDDVYVYDLLYAAFVLGKAEIVHFVLNNKLYASVNETYTEDAETPLTMACSFVNQKKALEFAQVLVSLGANVNGAGKSGGDYMKYPLVIAVSNNNIELTGFLLKNGANIEVRNSSDETILEIAENNNFQDIVSLLKSN